MKAKGGRGMNPFMGLLRSRKFWLLVLDLVLSLVLYFTGKYAGGGAAEDTKVVIGAIQPLFIAVIVGITVEDAADKASGNFPR